MGTARNRRVGEQDEPSRLGAVLVRVLGAVALGAALIATAHMGLRWARSTPRFAVGELTFHGLSRAAEAELVGLCGLAPGQNLWALDLEAAERSMQTHPWVRSVSLSRRLPDGVTVEVVEHEPSAMVALGDLYLVDAEGIPFKRVLPPDDLDLPLLTGVDRELYALEPETVHRRLRLALEALFVWREEGLEARAKVQEVRLTGEAVSLRVGTDGQEIRLGEGGLLEKLARLRTVWGELERQRLAAAVIHLDNRARPDWVAVRLSGPSSGGALRQ